MRSNSLAALAAISILFILSACGGGSSSSSSGSSTTISGSVVKGNVSGATVTIKNAATGAAIVTTTTDSSGAYSVSVSFNGDVIVEATGGTYTDEATGRATSLSTPLRVALTASGSPVTGMVTPLTSMAYTYAFGNSTTAVTASAYNTMAASVASQFKLTGVNITTTAPNVTGSMNDYGKVLASISKYQQVNNATLQSIINTQFTAAQLTQFSRDFNAAYQLAFPNSAITFNFDGTAFNIGGTNGGGGTGTCGVNVQGSVTANGTTIPVNLNYCVTGIAAGSCTSGNSSLSQALNGQSGLSGAVNLNYTFAASCAAGAITINLL